MIGHDLLKNLFEKKLSHQNLSKYCASVTKTYNDNKVDAGNFKVSCVQREINVVRDVKDYINCVSLLVEQAAKEGSNLVVFPEYNFFDLLGIIPGFSSVNRYANKRAVKSFNSKKSAQKKAEPKQNPFLRSILASTANPIADGIKFIYSSLAKEYNIYIYTGTYIENREGVLFNTGALFDNDGKLVGAQDKIHLTDFEVSIGLDRANNLKVYELPWGKIAFPICMDATYFETFQLARELGADIVIIPIANMEEYSLWRALRGMWPRVQESYVYGLKSSLNGWIGGMHFTGKAGIFAPLSITDKKDGLVEIAPEHEGSYVITAELDIQKLYMARQKDQYYGDKNYAFEKEYLTKTYKK
ncbi:nitrilase-related carbon-nitrogen hydrolase [Proteinivorax hydrogeniformans]|uniref:Nitrilase-related carbon-nitrogen hydrolase n=1 Tax=Proteinivorax hydrogeniformans TaxID=1826727 RepID=A0AAU8HQD7_9FIRM